MTNVASERTACAQPERLGWAWLALPIFVGVLLLGVFNHELWRDETQAWAVARDSGSLWRLLTNNLRYEGHPPLWYILLFVVTRVTRDPRAMQFLHAGIATAVVALILAKAPFPRWQRVVLSFGYFPLFEWGVLSRNYSLGLLAFLGYLVLYPARHKRLLPLAACLVVMANANAYALLVAGALAGALVFDAVINGDHAPATGGSVRDRIASGVLTIAGFAVSLYFLAPPPDRWSGRTIALSKHHLANALAVIWDGLVPLPEFANYHFWNTNIVTLSSLEETLIVRGLLGAALAVIALFLVRRKPVAFLFLFLSFVALCGFTFLKWPGFLRHHGHFFVVLIGALWLAHGHSESPPTWWPSLRRLGEATRFAPALVGLLACIHLAAGLFAVGVDLRYPFSDSLAAARYLKAVHLDHAPIVGSRDYLVSPLSTYLDVPIYYPEFGSWGSFWTARNRSRRFSAQFALEASVKLAAQRHETVVLALSTPLDGVPAGVRELEHFNSSLLSFDSGFSVLEPEFFYFYEVRPGNPAFEGLRPAP